MAKVSCGAAFVLTFALAAPAGADPIIVFSNFTGSGVSTCCGGWGVPGGGLLGDPNQDRAFEFTPLVTAKLTGLELVMRLDSESLVNAVDVSVASSSGGRPATVLESFHLTDTLPLADEPGSFVPLVAMSSRAHPLLQVGTTYWITASTTGPLRAIWLGNDTGASGLTAVRNEGDDWFVPGFTSGTGAMRIDADPVPEPSTILLVFSGCAAMALRRVRPGALLRNVRYRNCAPQPSERSTGK